MFGLRTAELVIFDLKIGFYVKFAPWGRVLRFQVWNRDPKVRKIRKFGDRLVQHSFFLFFCSACAGVCEVLSDCCTSVWDCVDEIFWRPFSGITFFGFLMNAVPLIGALVLLASGGEDAWYARPRLVALARRPLALRREESLYSESWGNARGVLAAASARDGYDTYNMRVVGDPL